MARTSDMKAYFRERYQQRRQTAIAQLGGKCAECGATEELEFDHIDPAAKSFNLWKRSGITEERFQAELAKCQLLCPTHHKQKTLRDRGQVSAKGTHGTLSSYRYCKCDECKAAKRASNQMQRQLRIAI